MAINMRRSTRRAISIAAVIVLALAGYFTYKYFGASAAQVPAGFADARAKGGAISEDIVRLSEELKGDIARANDLDKQRKFKEAGEVTAAAGVKVGDIRARALELVSELERMTGALPQIRNADARAAATDSIANRLELIKHLITYTEKVTDFLVALEEHFGGAKNEQVIEQLLYDINLEVEAINEFNRKAAEAMQRFDDLLK